MLNGLPLLDLCTRKEGSPKLGWSTGGLDQAVDLHEVLSIQTPDGERYFPVYQVCDGRIVRGLRWILNSLPDEVLDRQTLSAWLNASRSNLDGRSIWEILRE